VPAAFEMLTMEGKDMLAMTMDVDWAPDVVVEKCASMLDEFNIKATFFCTHRCEIKNHELAIHPNFLNENQNYFETLRKLISLFPGARGVRSHSLFTNSRLYPIYKQLGLSYESNYLMYRQTDIHPFKMLGDILQLPIFFMDDIHICLSPNSFDLKSLCLKKSGLEIFDFHPIHVFLNTRNLETYQKAKKYHQAPEELLKFYNPKSGIETLFIRLLNEIEKEKIKTYTLSEIDEIWRQKHV